MIRKRKQSLDTSVLKGLQREQKIWLIPMWKACTVSFSSSVFARSRSPRFFRIQHSLCFSFCELHARTAIPLYTITYSCNTSCYLSFSYCTSPFTFIVPSQSTFVSTKESNTVRLKDCVSKRPRRSFISHFDRLSNESEQNFNS